MSLPLALLKDWRESTALIVKVFSGILSDYIGKRKGLAVFGYAMGAFSKPLFAVASSTGIVLTARLLDRIGKGVRGAPRDALVADITPPHLRGAAFGLRQALDTVGAFLGPLLAVGLMLLWANDFRAVFWVAVIPGILAVTLLLFGIREPERSKSEKRINPIRRENLQRLNTSYWWVVAIGAIFMLARFSEAFLVLRGLQAGIPIALTPLVMVAMNLIYAASAYPFGKLSDRVQHTRLLALGLIVLIAADLVLAHSHHWSTAPGRGCTMGYPYGHDARPAGGHGGRYCTRRLARNGLWIFQSHEWVSHVGCQRIGWFRLGSVWRCNDVLHRGCFLFVGSGRIGLATSTLGRQSLK